MWSKRWFSVCLAVLMAAITLLAGSPARRAAQAAPADGGRQDPAPQRPAAPLATPVTFRVTVERVTATNNFDGPFDWDRADFHARVRIGDQILNHRSGVTRTISGPTGSSAGQSTWTTR